MSSNVAQRTPHRRLSGLAIALLLCLPPSAFAAKRYQVDLLVFTQPPLAAGQEQWNRELPPLDAELMARAVAPGDPQPPPPRSALPATIPLPGPEGEVAPAVTAASPDTSGFSDVIARLARRPDRTLIHSASWEQTVSDPATTPVIRVTDQVVTSDPTPPAARQTLPSARPTPDAEPLTPPLPRLDGYVNFFVSEHYALELDLRLTPPADAVESAVTGGTGLPASGDEGIAPVSYRIHETRHMKSGDLNYYDHPRFGVLLLVTPVAESAAADPVPPNQPAARP